MVDTGKEECRDEMTQERKEELTRGMKEGGNEEREEIGEQMVSSREERH